MSRFELIRRIAYGLLVLTVTLCLGCRKVECYSYRPILASDDLSKDLAEWADSEIFSRKFVKTELSSGRLAGPGSYAVPKRKFGLHLPSYVIDGEVRPLFSKSGSVVAVFIGNTSYNGVIIAKESIDSAYRDLDFTKGPEDEVNGRVTLVCSN